VRRAAGESEDGPQGESVAGSEERAIGDETGERPQRSVFAAEQIVGEIEGSEHIERTTDDADQRERVAIDCHCHGSVTDWPLSRMRNESPGSHARRSRLGVSIPSSASWKVP
jgi:hypothetical protein